MPESIVISSIIPASRDKIYKAWLNSKEHTAFTGAEAGATAKKGGKFTAWDGYISGKNIELIPGEKIIQSWRTTEFKQEDPDSVLEVILEDHQGGTKVTFKHSNIPRGQGKGYKQGWIDFYFKPMKEYFGSH